MNFHRKDKRVILEDINKSKIEVIINEIQQINKNMCLIKQNYSYLH